MKITTTNGVGGRYRNTVAIALQGVKPMSSDFPGNQ